MTINEGCERWLQRNQAVMRRGRKESVVDEIGMRFSPFVLGSWKGRERFKR
jgi:hypothetical protein